MQLAHTPLIWLFQAYWRDEAFSVILTKRPILELLSITAKDFSPPLYYLILKYWMMVFGNSEVATRLLSFTFFVLLIIAVIAFCYKHLKLRVWQIFFVAITTSLSPILSYYAFETRMYSLIALLSTLSWLALLMNRRKQYVVFSILALYTQYFQIFVIASQILYLIVLQCKNHTNRVTLINTLKTHLINFLIIGICFFPWILYVAISHDKNSVTSFWILPPTIQDVLHMPSILLTGYEHDFPFKFNLSTINALVYIFFVVSIVPLTKTFSKKFNTEKLAYLFWFFIPGIMVSVLSLFGPSLFLPRYLIVSVPAFYISFAATIRDEKIKKLVVLLVVFLITLKLYDYQQIEIKKRTKEDVRPIFASINRQTSENDSLYLESELDFHLAQYYFKNTENVYVIGKPYSQLPSYVGKSLIPENKVQIAFPPNAKGIFLYSDRSMKVISE
ncbi:MAG: hypothetical protein U0525_00975 [Patescibacteria group bacterium]